MLCTLTLSTANHNRDLREQWPVTISWPFVLIFDIIIFLISTFCLVLCDSVVIFLRTLCIALDTLSSYSCYVKWTIILSSICCTETLTNAACGLWSYCIYWFYILSSPFMYILLLFFLLHSCQHFYKAKDDDDVSFLWFVLNLGFYYYRKLSKTGVLC